MRSDYPKPVTYIRALTLICFSFGLFVQVAAQAAVPQIEVAGTTDCAEMVQGMPNHPMPGQVIADKDKVDQHGPCREMTLDCLVAMNCLRTCLYYINIVVFVTLKCYNRRIYLPSICLTVLSTSIKKQFFSFYS